MSGSGFSDPVRNLTIQDNKIHSSGEDGVKVSQAYNVKVVHNDITNSGSEGVDFVAVNGFPDLRQHHQGCRWHRRHRGQRRVEQR